MLISVQHAWPSSVTDLEQGARCGRELAAFDSKGTDVGKHEACSSSLLSTIPNRSDQQPRPKVQAFPQPFGRVYACSRI